MVSWDCKAHNSASSLFLLLIITKACRLAEIRWSVCISKSQSVRQWSVTPGFNFRSIHTKDSKNMILDASLLNTQHYKVLIKGKWSNPGKGVALLLTLWRSSCWKRSLRVAFGYWWPTYLCIYIYIYIYQEQIDEKKNVLWKNKKLNTCNNTCDPLRKV